MEQKSITIVGMGYVGMSLAALLGQKHIVYAVDIVPEKLELIKTGISPVKDDLIEEYMKSGKTKIIVPENAQEAYTDADYIILAVPTDYDPNNHSFNTSEVEHVVQDVLQVTRDAVIVIKSTVPFGYTRKLTAETRCERLLFSPEFLRESKALYDNLHPSRIIVGTDLADPALTDLANDFADLMEDASDEEHVLKLVMGASEAEAVKLFANTYLAMRISFFNELDTFAEIKELQTEQIIAGVSADPRIGDYYNNPSFGYGGYCLPKDTRQLAADYSGIPMELILSVVEANQTRKKHIAQRVIECASRDKSESEDVTVGVYRLVMKQGSENFRQTSVQGVIDYVRKEGANIVIFEPLLPEGSDFDGCVVVDDFDRFLEMSDIIIANRYDEALDDVRDKVYTRDLFRRD